VAPLPELPANEPVYVADYRFRDKRAGLNGIRYVITNQTWIVDPANIKLKELFEAQKREKVSRDRFMRAVAAVRGVATRRAVVPLLIGAGLVLGICVSVALLFSRRE
jgi:hypothetical protein